MVKMYRTDIETNICNEVKDFERGTWINMINPTEKEIESICYNLKIKDNFI